MLEFLRSCSLLFITLVVVDQCVENNTIRDNCTELIQKERFVSIQRYKVFLFPTKRYLKKGTVVPFECKRNVPSKTEH